MLLHNNPLFQIYFGNAKDLLFPKDYLNIPKGKDLLTIDSYAPLQKLMQLDSLLFLRQEHTDSGIIVGEQEAKTMRPFEFVGDCLITDQSSVGIGVMTADCLPIVFFDNFNHVVGVVHAGWRGSVDKIALNVIKQMQERFETDLAHVRVFFGPSIKSCCYKVGEEFYDHLKDFKYRDQVLLKRGDDVFFDLPGFNKLQLESIGLKKESFKLGNNLCTVCDEQFCSYRRDGKKSGRQMTVVSLK